MAIGRTRMRMVELFAVIVIIVVLALVFLPVLRPDRTIVEPRSCAANLKQWSSIFSIYAKENRWRYPPVHGFESFLRAENAYHCKGVSDDFDFCPDLRAVYPDYATDLGLLVCPDSGYLKPAKTVGPIVFRGSQVDAEALGIVAGDGSGKCEYEGLITNGDLCYTYFGWKLNQPDTGGVYVDEETARRLNLPATGPAEVTAILAQVEPNRARQQQDGRGPRYALGYRDENIDLPALFPPGVEFTDVFPPILIPVTETISNRAPPVLSRLWDGYYQSEIEEGDLAEAARRGEPPPPRAWHAVTPILWDTVPQDREGNPQFTHRNPDGVNVLYMDGHVEFVAYPGKFPASKEFATLRRIR